MPSQIPTGIRSSQLEKAISLAFAKSNLGGKRQFKDLAEEEVATTLGREQAPSGWASFYEDIIASAIQSEIIALGSFSPGMPAYLKRLKQQKEETNTWQALFDYIWEDENLVPISGG